jgi:hypothetical protein
VKQKVTLKEKAENASNWKISSAQENNLQNITIEPLFKN